MDGFKKFIMRGNLVELAVAFIIGVAFAALVTAFTKDIITPIIGIFGGTPDFSGLYFTINGSKFLYGEFLNALISFLITALIVYYFVVLPMNALVARMRTAPPADPTTKKCPECLSEIPLAAHRCAFCGSVQPDVTAPVPLR